MKALIKEFPSAKNGAVGNFWVISLDAYKPNSEQLNIICDLYVNRQAFENKLDPIDKKYFKCLTYGLNEGHVQAFAFNFIKQDPFFEGGVEEDV